MKRINSVGIVVLLSAGLAWLSPAAADDQSSTQIGRQAVGLVASGMLPVRLMPAQASKGGFKFQVQRVKDGAAAHRLPGASRSRDIFLGAY